MYKEHPPPSLHCSASFLGPWSCTLGSCVGTQVRRWEQQDLSRLCCLSLPLTRLLTSLDLEAVLPVSAAVMADVVLATPAQCQGGAST